MFDWFYKIAVPARHRPVLRVHPLAFWFSLGILLTGIANIVHPTHDSAASVALPQWLLTVFNIVWTSGGGLAVFGITRGKARYEAAGMALMGASFLTYFAVLIRVLPQSVWTGGFILTIAVGCLRRALVLARGQGYEEVLEGEWERR